MTSEDEFGESVEAAGKLRAALEEVGGQAAETSAAMTDLTTKAKRPVRRRKVDTTPVASDASDAKVEWTGGSGPIRMGERIRLCLYPRAEGEDDGQGGVRRVIEAQQIHLPDYGIDLVDDPAQADVLASHIYFPPEWVKRFPDKPMVLHCHGLYWAEYQWRDWEHKANRDVMEGIRIADAVTVPSRWVHDVVAKHTCREARIIPHGVDLEEFSPRTAAPRREDGTLDEPVPFVLWDKTRPDPVCDPAPMNAVARLLPDVQFVSTFGEQAPNVQLAGRLAYKVARQLTRNASVYLATSRETFGIATLQALACGVPVVGYAWGANPELLTDGVDSYLVEPGDVQGLAEGIRWALDNPDAGLLARETAERYPWPKVVGEYADLYRDVLAERREARPRVSVVVTAYNLAKTLPETLDSLLMQTEKNWECVIVDDASPDDCGLIADRAAAADPRFVAVHNERNLYQAGARNAGIAASRGRYILPLDADDMLAPNAVQLLADALDEDRTIHIAYGNVFFVGEDGETPMIYRRQDGTPYPAGHSDWPYEFDWNSQRQGYNLLPYSSMFRREVWEQTGGFRERLRNDDDPDFWLRAASYGYRPRRVTLADTLIYRVRPDSMSRTVAHGDWSSWFGWKSQPLRSPAGAALADGTKQLPIPSWSPPAISVVIPVGPGHERLVQRAVDSLEAQTFGWFECIVVKDTEAPLAGLPSWVKIGNPVQSGVAGARNYGALAAKGKYLLFLDADDFLQPEALEVWWAAAKARPGTILYADMWEDPKAAGQWQMLEWPDAAADNLINHGVIGAVTQLIPRAVFDMVGGFEDKPWEDWRFYLKAAKLGFCSARIARPLWSYSKHTGMRRDSQLERSAYLEGKASVLADFGEFFPADQFSAPKEKLMACGCAKATTATIAAPSAPVNGPEKPDGDAALMGYSGPQINVKYRGPSGHVYKWSTGATMYVLAEDVEFFRTREGFAVVEQSGEGFGPIPQAPVLA